MTEISAKSVDGVLLLDKPTGITSNAAIQRVKRVLRAAKAGHVGTLDPLASGLLPVCLGEGTKFSSGAFGADKSYDADIQLGVTTVTGDTEGEVIARQTVEVSRAQVAEVLRCVTGNIEQVPPMYSAIKHHGKPLYAYARAGQSVPRAPRNITIHDITLKGFSADRLQIGVNCSKGTYIRVLAEEIGRLLGCGATLAGLRRVALGRFDVTEAVTLHQLEALDESQRMAAVLPVDTLVSALPRLQLDEVQQRRVMTGRTAQQPDGEVTGLVRLYDQEQHFLGLGEVVGGVLMPKRLVATSMPGAFGSLEM